MEKEKIRLAISDKEQWTMKIKSMNNYARLFHFLISNNWKILREYIYSTEIYGNTQ